MNSLQTARRLLATFQELPSIFSRPPLNLALASKLAKCNAASRATTEKARKALQGNKILQILTNCLLHRRWAVGLKHKRPPSGDRCLRFAPASPPRLWLPTLPESWLQGHKIVTKLQFELEKNWRACLAFSGALSLSGITLALR